ncbi:MAG: hypothetical protein LLF94_02760 [Chlamydiales bacterium]|nr:hypothetical protein [Chlamydiales bacterium]
MASVTATTPQNSLQIMAPPVLATEGAHQKCHDLGIISLSQGGLFQCQLEYDSKSEQLSNRWLFRVPGLNEHTRLRQVMEEHLKVQVSGHDQLAITIFLASCQIKKLSYNTTTKELHTEFSYPLTYYDLRRLNQYGISDIEAINRRSKIPEVLAFPADLHTHFGGALTEEMMAKAIFESKEPVLYPISSLKEMGIAYNASVDSKNMIDLRAPDTQFPKEKFLRSLIMDPLGIASFLDMEVVYRLRGPIVKNLKLFPVFLELLAQDYQKYGVTYVELSISDIVKPEWMAEVVKVLPELEKKYGVKLRFLVSLWRHSPKKYNQDVINQTKSYLEAGNPYIVGFDYMGHETNSTRDFIDHLDEIASFKKIRPDLVIRVHAGESPCHPENVRLAIQHGANRIGHGLHGFDDEMMQEAKDRDVIVEFNISSNLSLNSAIRPEDDIPIKKFIDKNIRVTIGTDGHGCYGTTPQLEALLASEMSLTPDDIAYIRASDVRYITEMNAAFDARIQAATASSFAPVLPAPITPSDEWTRLDKERLEKKQNIVDMLQKTLSLQVVKTTDIPTHFAGKVPVLFAGATSTSWDPIPEEDKELLRTQIRRLFYHLNDKNVFIITGGTDFGLEKIVHEVVHEYARHGRQFSLLGTLASELQADPSTISKSLTHATIIDGTWYDLAPGILKVVSDMRGTAFFMTGGDVVKNMIQIAKNLGGIDYKILQDVQGTSAKMAEILPEKGFSKHDALDKALQKMRPELLRSMTADNKEAFGYFSGINKEVVSFLGYSSAYENPVELKAKLTQILDQLDSAKTIIAAGATKAGIGAVYELAKTKGFTTLGIVSTNAIETNSISPHADFVLYVEDPLWGGYVDGEKLSLVSEVISHCSHWAIRLGGGSIATIEADHMHTLGKDVLYYPFAKSLV